MLGDHVAEHLECSAVDARRPREPEDVLDSPVVDGAFVPSHRVMPMMGLGPQSGAWQLHNRDSYRLPSMAMLPFTLASPIVGMVTGIGGMLIALFKG